MNRCLRVIHLGLLRLGVDPFCRDRDCDLCRFTYPVIGWAVVGPVIAEAPCEPAG